MRTQSKIVVALTFFVVLITPLSGREKKEPEKEAIVQFRGEDFPIREGPESLRDNDEEIKRKEAACKTKYQGKLVKVLGIVAKRPDEKAVPQVYTLSVSFAYKKGQRFVNGFQSVDVIPSKAAPELNQPSRSGLIAGVVGQGHIDAKGRLILKDAKVLSTNIPPG